MPTYEVTLPSGTFEVEAQNDAALPAIIAQLTGGSSGENAQAGQVAGTSASGAPSVPEMGRLERYVRGFGKNFMGLGQTMANAGLDPTMGAAGEVGATPADTARAMNNTLAAEQKDYEARKPAGWDIAGGLGELTSMAPMAMAGVPATIPGMAAAGAGQGFLNALATPVTDNTRPFWDQKATQAVIGAGTGAVATPIMGMIGKAFSPTINDEVQYILGQGGRLTPGQIVGGAANAAEEKATILPLVGDMISGTRKQSIADINRIAYKQVLDPIGKKVTAPVGSQAVAQVKQAVSDAYNELLPKLRFVADDAFNAQANELKVLVSNLPNKASAKEFNNIWTSEVQSRISPNGVMDGISFKEMESNLSGYVNDYLRGNANDKAVGRALKQGLTLLRANLDRSNPEFAGQLQAINKAFIGRKIIANAAKSSMKSDGVFTPAQLLRSSQRAAPGAFESLQAPLQKLGRAAENVVGSKYPDSGTAGRLAQAALGGGAGYLAYAHPGTLVGGAALALPYTQWGRSLAQNLLAGSRGPLATQVGNLLSRSALPIGSAASFAVTP